MNWNQIESGWNGSAKVQEAYGITKEETERQISAWQSRQVEQKPAQAAK